MDSRITQLEMLIEEGKKYTFHNFCFPNESGSQYGGTDKPEWLLWKNSVFSRINQVVSEGSPAVKLAKIGLELETKGYYSDHFEQAKGSLLRALEIAIEALKDDKFNEIQRAVSEHTSKSLSNKIFIVHGHDNAFKTEVETFIHQIGLEPVVLHRQPDQGKTIIEKFEKHSDVGYAIILLTEDEIAYTIDQDSQPDDKRKKEKRARPNVIFEFGYFVGKLGRGRVCCLHKGDVTLPSDVSGIIYKKIEGSLDNQAYSIIKELKSAGYNLKI